MSKTSVVTFRAEPEIVALLDKLAESVGRSRASIAAEAIKAYAEEQAAFLEFIEEGDRDFAEGNVLSEEEMNVWLQDRIANARAEVAKRNAA